MKFIDEVRIQVKAGDGGNGAVAFRREKYVERGGPSGGDGGNGGSVSFEADPQLTTLLDYRYQPNHQAQNGQAGMGSDCNGRGGEDLVLRVPVGTLLRNEATGEVLHDLSEPGQRVLVAKGGRGGLGNMNFATSTRQTPRFAQDGTPGEELHLVLELKLLADVGLLGFPNVGKSTLVSVVSRAHPKIADYPFTTLVPNLGMVQYKDGLSFVMADIPGLIEGASEGAGLGLQFLRHVERCRLLIHMVDVAAPGEERDPVRDFDIINRELERFSPELATKPQLVAATKMDLPDEREHLEAFRKAMARRGLKVFAISAATREGVQALMDAAAEVLFTGRTDVARVELPERPRAAAPAKKVAKAVERRAKAATRSARGAKVAKGAARGTKVSKGAAKPVKLSTRGVKAAKAVKGAASARKGSGKTAARTSAGPRRATRKAGAR